MSDIRRLADEDFAAAAYIFAEAYPGLKITSAEDRAGLQGRLQKFHQEDPTANFYGLFRQEALLGIMALYDFEMNFLGVPMPVGGVGQVAVALPHKKEHVCKELILFFLRHYRRQAVPFTALYPFRPDFYHKMGFGYGPRMSQYRLEPTSFPKGPSKAGIRTLDEGDKAALARCYDRVADQTHGLMRRTEWELRRLFTKPDHRLIGYEKGGEIRGYLVYTWQQGETFLLNDMHVQEFVYETPAALAELCTYLHSQADQVRQVIVDTQDEHFHHLLVDPRNDSDRLIPSVYHETNSQGVGLMYRVVDVPDIFRRLAARDFGTQTCSLKLIIDDGFLPENGGSILLRFEAGRVHQPGNGAADVEVRLDIADFSSLLAGTATFRSLYRYGRAEISSEDYVDTVHRIFAVDEKPRCTTDF